MHHERKRLDLGPREELGYAQLQEGRFQLRKDHPQ
jgi:hypothetical protein